MAEQNTNPRYHWLDWIRVIATVSVMTGHFRNAFFPEFAELPDKNLLISLFYFLTKWGHQAVIVFFILSGFLVGGRTIEKMLCGSFNFKNYAIDRSVRIGLPLIGTVLFYIPIRIVFVQKEIPWSMVWGNLLSLQGVACEPLLEPFWSLSYEVWFYVLIGSLGAFSVCSGGKKIAALLGLFLALLIFTKLSATYLFVLFLGTLVYFIKAEHFSFWKCLLSAGLLFAALFQLPPSVSELIGNDFFIAMSFSWFMREIIALKPCGKLMSIIDGIGRIFAKMSYTLYLSHFLLILILFNVRYTLSSNCNMSIQQDCRNDLISIKLPAFDTVNFNTFFTYSFSVITGVIFAYFLYFMFERNTYRVKQFFKKSKVDIKKIF